jgi:hypothetical protein
VSFPFQKTLRALSHSSLLALVAISATACASTAAPQLDAQPLGVELDPLEDAHENVHTTPNIGDGMITKGSRGLVNTLTGWIEFPAQIFKGYERGVGFIDNNAGSTTVGTVLGVFSGATHAVGRTGYGLLELFGFWTANPNTNHDVGVPLDAKYAWEDGEAYSVFEPTFGDGIMPYPNKLVRGLGNGIGGIVELPGQTAKGFRQDEPGTGFVKGIWFSVSRIVYGFGDAVGFLLPNPPDQVGYSFEEKWPWDAISGDHDDE